MLGGKITLRKGRFVRIFWRNGDVILYVYRKLSLLLQILLLYGAYGVVPSLIRRYWMRFKHLGGFCWFGINRWLRKLMYLLVSSLLVFFLGELWIVLIGPALVFVVPMLINIVLLYGRSYLGFVSSGTQLDFYLVILILLDTLTRGMVVSLLAQPCSYSQTLLRIII